MAREQDMLEISDRDRALLESVLEEVHSEIPKNSPTLLVDETTSRFNSAIWYDAVKASQITLAGLGGIGSYVAFLLARMKPGKMHIYDPDKVETVNMSGQLFSLQNVGQFKVNGIYEMAKNYADYRQIDVIPERFEESSVATKIMICGFDNMVARKLYFEAWERLVNSLSEEDRDQCLFIDGRLAAEEFQIFCLQGNDSRRIASYKNEQLFSDEEADATICSYKQTTFMANMIGSLIVNLFVNFMANKCNPLMERDLPYCTEYVAETMYFKTLT